MQRGGGEKSGWAGWPGTGRGECFFFPSLSLALSISPFLPFLWQCFSTVIGSSWRGSGRSRQRQSQHSSDLVRNAAVLYCFFLYSPHPPFVSPDCVWLQCRAQMFACSPLWRRMFEKTGQGVICDCMCMFAGRGGCLYANMSLCVHS